MNNQNDSNQQPEPQPESSWAEFIEQQGQSLNPDSQVQLPFSLEELDAQQLEDLQLDGRLRMLGRLSVPDDSFVDAVVARTSAVSRQETSSAARLPVIAPVFESETAAELTSQGDLNEPPISSSAEGSFPISKAVAILVSIAAAITIAFLIWGVNGNDPKTPSNQNFANHPTLQDSNESVDPFNESIELTPPTNEGIAVQPNPKTNPDSRQDSENHLDQPESLAENPLQRPPVLMDDKKAPRMIDQPPQGGMKIVSSDPVPRVQWHLAIDFQNNGVGSITLNDQSINGSLLVDNADFVLRQLGDEFTRRVRFFENRLGAELSGSIKIGSAKYAFQSVNEIEPAIELACKHFATLETANLSISDFAQLRKSIRQLMLKNPSAITSIDLMNQQIAFSTEDEVFTICSVLAATKSSLQNTAKQRLAWEQRQNYQVPKDFAVADSITPKAFSDFAANGQLVLSTPNNDSQKFSTLQNLDEQELKEVLYKTIGSFDLFNDIKEFRRAELNISKEAKSFQQFVAKKLKTVSKAPLADQPQLTEEMLAKIDRTGLESKRFTLSKDDRYAHRLPLVMGNECRSGKHDAAAIELVSNTLGTAVNQFDPSLGSRDPSNNDAFRIRELKKQFKAATDASTDPQRLKTSDQILQIDHPRMRLELIEALGKSKTDTALKLLAKRAKFDLVPEVRLAATTALARFPREQYRDELLAGLKYPWHVVAEHSAEALVRLGDQEALPKLVAMLDLPHPNAPVEIDRNKFVQPELVAINHMRNCLLCHAPAGSSHEIATGVVPSWGKPLPKQYYKSEKDDSMSVRADVTYLEQDFSVVQPVMNHGPWPRDQRFDYVVQQRPIKGTKAKQLNKQLADVPNLNRDAIVFALQQLTQKTPDDNSSASWRAVLKRHQAEPAQ